MSEVKLEHFSTLRAPFIGRKLAELIDENREWLEGSERSGAVTRYGQGALRAAMNIKRIAANNTLHAYLIHARKYDGDSSAAGIATIITHQAIRHPKTGVTVAGTDVDYWLGDRAASIAGIFPAVANRLAAEGWKHTPWNHDNKKQLFATTIPGALHQPWWPAETGFSAVDGPAALELAASYYEPHDRGDRFGILKDGQTLQLWEASMSRNPATPGEQHQQ